MTDIAIRVDNLSKQYKLGATIRHDRLKDLLTSGLNGLFRRSRSPVSGPPSSDGSQSDYFWALKDVSFEVKQGETLGIIGANGAGKSTLLKILSRITEPTSGRAEMYGRVGSLLEVGTGFDRELTGRENIYLSGAVLGMRKAEIGRKFDEIVDFSGVEKFIETPVKRYSSGMYVRLAFAVAAHLEPEILIVDEVLAVGDAAIPRWFLQRHQVQVVMGEYLDGSLPWLMLAQELGIRFFGHAHGYDVSKQLRDPKWVGHAVGLIAVPEIPVIMQLSPNAPGGWSRSVRYLTTGRAILERNARLRDDMGRRRTQSPITWAKLASQPPRAFISIFSKPEFRRCRSRAKGV